MMLNTFQSIILGILQGLGEFLPISSTAHLILAPYFFGWSDPGLAFDVALHIGTLVAVIAYFWRDWLEIFAMTTKTIIISKRQTPNVQMSNVKRQMLNATGNYPSNLLWLLFVASIPGAIVGFLLNSYAEHFFRSPLIIAFTLSFVGLILYWVDKQSTCKKDIKQISLKDAALIGFSQALAIIPGVSRSGATMAAGLSLGLSREQAAKFSFLLSTPIILGAAIIKLPELVQNGISWPIILGIIAAAVSGYVAIKYMLRFIQRVGYAPFFWYRLILALAVLIVFYLK
jgi:undecaprenyl-diphosphatase